MEEITIKNVIPILKSVIDKVDEQALMKKSEEELYETDLYLEYDLDSLDLAEMYERLDDLYGINIEPNNRLTKHAFYSKPTVRHFIWMCNKCKP